MRRHRAVPSGLADLVGWAALLGWAAVVLVLVAGQPAGAQAVDCPALEAEARAHWAHIGESGPSRDALAGLTAAHDAATAGGCGDDLRLGLGTLAARAAYLVADAARGLGLEERRALLRDARERARVWQALALLGDLDGEAGDRAASARHYQEALDAIADERATPKPPEPAVIGQIFEKAEAARLLADDYVSTTRSLGMPGGLARGQVRGFVVRKVAVPITFAFDTAAFDERGERYVREMLAYLEEAGEPDITLIGHTDPRGSEDYNLDLSIRRAEAVAAYLRDAGYGGAIEATGRGESDPIVLDDPEAYTEEERFRLGRRVELER